MQWIEIAPKDINFREKFCNDYGSLSLEYIFKDVEISV